jgi:hypothetical protein
MLPLAISVLKNEGSGNENILFKQDMTGITNFLELISNLHIDSDLLITDDANVVLQILNGLNFYIKKDYDLNFQKIQKNLLE